MATDAAEPRKRDTLVPDFPADLGKGISGFDAWLAVAPSGAADAMRTLCAASERALRERIRRIAFTWAASGSPAALECARQIADLLDGGTDE